MRGFLNQLYKFAEILAMAALCLIAGMVFAQVAGRVFDGALGLFGQSPYGFLIPSLAEIAGFLLVAASFLALAGSMRAGEQIRVTLALGRLPARSRLIVEIAVLAIAVLLTGYFFFYAVQFVLQSHRYNEVSYGIIPIPLFIPQAAMAAGIGIFTVSLLDDLICAVSGGETSYGKADAEKSANVHGAGEL